MIGLGRVLSKKYGNWEEFCENYGYCECEISPEKCDEVCKIPPRPEIARGVQSVAWHEEQGETTVDREGENELADDGLDLDMFAQEGVNKVTREAGLRPLTPTSARKLAERNLQQTP